MDSEEIAKIETAAADALPSAHTESYDGWRLRYNYGVTRRANSVLAEYEGEIILEEKLERVEAWYKDLGVKVRFQLCPSSKPEGLQNTLVQRDYSIHSGANVMRAKVQDVLLAKQNKTINIELKSTLNAAWLKVYETCEAAPLEKANIRKQMLEKLECPAAFAIAFIEGEPAAVGLGVLGHQCAGVFNMATLPQMRKQGAAKAVLLGISGWAQELKARQIYLQVAEENHVAQSVYKKSGFQMLYTYRYFEQG